MRWFIALVSVLWMVGCGPPAGRPETAETQSADVAAWLSKAAARGRVEATDPYAETDVESLISIRKPEHVAIARQALVARLWGTQGLPTSLPRRGDHPRLTAYFDDLGGLAGAESWVVSMEGGFESIVFLLLPKLPRNRAVIYHESHETSDSREILEQLLVAGCHVAVVSMPLRGPNPRPTLVSPRFGRMKLDHHDHMAYVRPEHGHAMKYFLEPVVVMTNYLERELPDAAIHMMGVSGGGWTTTLSAAIDPRLSKSFPVAGSYPIHIRTEAPWDWGDWEQTVRDVYEVTNYLEIYVLGASGVGRKQIQILNQFDPCCFSGIKSNAYKGIVARRVKELGAGEFEVLRDDSHEEHKISDAAMVRILAEITTP